MAKNNKNVAPDKLVQPEIREEAPVVKEEDSKRAGAIESKLKSLGCDEAEVIEDKEGENLHAIVEKDSVRRIVTVPYDTDDKEAADLLFAQTGF